MKRVLLAITGTVMGLVGLLSFKSHSTADTAGALPSAGLAGGATSTASPTTSAGTGSSSGTGSAASTGSSATSAKTFSGSAVQTRYGTVQVGITVSGTKITNVSFLQLTSDDPRSAEINSEAGPQLLQETLDAQSANIDTISGATYTTDGYVQSLQSALDQAGIK